MTKKEFNWNNIKESNELIISEGKTVRIRFLNNDVNTDKIDIKGKEKNKYIFDILNLFNQKEMEFGIISNPLMNELKKYQPLENKEFSIRKYRVGASEFDIEYELNHLNP